MTGKHVHPQMLFDDDFCSLERVLQAEHVVSFISIAELLVVMTECGIST